jgi:hypothetical protein
MERVRAMSSSFRSESTDEFAFARFYGGSERGVCLEFVTEPNFQRVHAAASAGERFSNEYGETYDWSDLLLFEAREAVWVGRFTPTMEAGEAIALELDELSESGNE